MKQSHLKTLQKLLLARQGGYKTAFKNKKPYSDFFVQISEHKSFIYLVSKESV